MNKQKKITLFILLAIGIWAHAQVTTGIRPLSSQFSSRLFAAPDVRTFTFDQLRADKLDRRDDKAGHMPKFARSIMTDINLVNAGTWTAIPGGRVWRLRLSSPGALALIPCYDQFYIPEGAFLHVYTPAKEEVIGAFTAANNPAGGGYNTGLIHGDACILEYYEPDGVKGQGRIHLNELGHAYRMVPARRQVQDFGDAESCEVNPPCPEGTDWQDQKNAVVRVLVKNGNSYGWCSGSLLNNANRDCTPFILSADHCYQDDETGQGEVEGQVATAADLLRWMFYFQYESPTCANPAAEGTLGTKFITGCKLVSASLDTGGNGGSDFVLLKMNSSPPLSYIPYYAGWSNVDTISPHGVGIHHPAADIKKISTYTTPLQSVSWGGEVANTHWQVQWAATVSGHGVTEPGSSGSPIFDASHHIIGTLTGGSSDCTTPEETDLYGKFAFHWQGNGSTAATHLREWLDPGNTGITTLDGTYAPCTAVAALDAGISGIAQAGNICDSGIALTATLVNYGSATLTSVTVSFSVNGGPAQQVQWTGALATLKSTQVSLPLQVFLTGAHTVTARSSAPNGGTDANAANDQATGRFTVVPATGQYTFSLQLGDEGSQIDWELTDTLDHILYSGGGYSDHPGGELVAQKWCLPPACYRFTIFSSSGNGLKGRNLSGDYSVMDYDGRIVAHMQHLDFDSTESVSFCPITTTDPTINGLYVFPNPSAGLFTVSNAENATSYTVTDAIGRIVRRVALSGQAIFTIDMTGEAQGLYIFKFFSATGSRVKKVVLK